MKTILTFDSKLNNTIYINFRSVCMFFIIFYKESEDSKFELCILDVKINPDEG